MLWGICKLKQQITLRIVLLKHNSLKSDIFFNLIFISCFSWPRFFRVQVFQGPAYSGSRFFRVQVIHGRDFSGSRFFKVRVQGLGPGFRISQQIYLKKAVSQQTFTCSKSTIGTRNGKVNKKDTKATSKTSFWCLYC